MPRNPFWEKRYNFLQEQYFAPAIYYLENEYTLFTVRTIL